MAVIPTFAANDVLTAANMNLVAGAAQQGSRNAIINGAFDFWQRGTSFSTTQQYTADRWKIANDSTFTISKQTFTPGTAPVAGYEAASYLRLARNAGGSYAQFYQPIEDVRSFPAGTITLSFWAKADVAVNYTPNIGLNYGTGGSAYTFGTVSGSVTLTTSWVRYERQITVPSFTGKTIGANSSIDLYPIYLTGSAAATVDIWGVQLEAGSVATPFKRNAPSIQAELAACQRYYWRAGGDSLYQVFGHGPNANSTTSVTFIQHPVTMRVAPTSLEFSTLAVANGGGSSWAVTSAALNSPSKFSTIVNAVVSSGLTITQDNILQTNNSLSGYIGFSAEL